MSNQEANQRVLGRMGARTLTQEELNQVSGGFHTGNCTFNPTTCAMDGDCSPPPGC